MCKVEINIRSNKFSKNLYCKDARRLKNSRSEYEDIESSDTDSEVENILNRRIPRRTLIMPSSSSDESDDQSEITADGTMWNEIKAGSSPGRRAIHTIFKKANGSTAFTKYNKRYCG